jgi:hypothetical protein
MRETSERRLTEKGGGIYYTPLSSFIVARFGSISMSDAGLKRTSKLHKIWLTTVYKQSLQKTTNLSAAFFSRSPHFILLRTNLKWTFYLFFEFFFVLCNSFNKKRFHFRPLPSFVDIFIWIVLCYIDVCVSVCHAVRLEANTHIKGQLVNTDKNKKILCNNQTSPPASSF